MGALSRIFSVILRVIELISAIIVVSILGRFLTFVHRARDHAPGRTVYTEVWAGITILGAIVMMPPLRYSFWLFPVDFILFIGWMVAFGLLVHLGGTHTCSSGWYNNTWGYYWGGFYRGGYDYSNSYYGNGCSKWNNVLGWSFIAGFCFLLSGILGMYVIWKHKSGREGVRELHDGNHLEKNQYGHQNGQNGLNGHHNGINPTNGTNGTHGGNETIHGNTSVPLGSATAT